MSLTQCKAASCTLLYSPNWCGARGPYGLTKLPFPQVVCALSSLKLEEMSTLNQAEGFSAEPGVSRDAELGVYELIHN